MNSRSAQAFAGALAPSSGEGTMSSLLKRVHWLLLCVTVSVAAAGQLLPAQLGKSPTEAATQPATDPLGRDTPSGTIYGFLQAAQAGNYSIAAQYLQFPSNAKRAEQGEELATKLKEVMDRAFSGNLRLISNRPEGIPQEGVSPDHQRIGALSAGDVDADLTLDHVSNSGGGRIWLISSETLAKVPDLYDRLEVHRVEARLPNFMVRWQFLGLPAWQWLAILLAIPIAAGLGWLLISIVALSSKLRRAQAPRTPAWHSISRPLWLLSGAVIHVLCVR